MNTDIHVVNDSGRLRSNATQALQDSGLLLSDIIDFLPDATLAIDKDKRVII
jgi:hypothetical protein